MLVTTILEAAPNGSKFSWASEFSSTITSVILLCEGVLVTADAARTVRHRSTDGGVVQATLRVQWDTLVTPDARKALRVASLIQNGADVPRATLALLAGISDEARGGYPAPLEAALNELKESSLLVTWLTGRAWFVIKHKIEGPT